MKTILYYQNTNTIKHFPNGYKVSGVAIPIGLVVDGVWLLEEIDTPRPDYNSDKEVITSSWVKDTDNNEYRREWVKRNKTTEEITAQINSEAESARQQVIEEELEKERTSKYTAAIEAVKSLPDVEALEKAHIFPPFVIGKTYSLNDRFFWPRNKKLYKVAQSHTSSAEWFPDTTPALYVEILPPGQIGEWKQPAGAHDAYQIGDRVTFNGQTWESTAANNVWQPGVFGWVVV